MAQSKGFDDSDLTSIFNSPLTLPQTIKVQQKPGKNVQYDLHDYSNPYGKFDSGIPTIDGLDPSANKTYQIQKGKKYNDLNRKVAVSRGFTKPKAQKINYMTNLIELIGSKANKDIVRKDDLISSAGASMWIDKHHRDEGWTVEKKDEDGDGIPEVMVYRPDGEIYSMNGYHLKRSDMGTRQPYYEQFPTRKERQRAREEDGITMNRYAAMKYKPKPFDLKKPFEIEYQDNPYDDPVYLKQLLTHRAPRIPTTRSAYQVFTMMITKPIWNEFKKWLLPAKEGGQSPITNGLTHNAGTEKEPKYVFNNIKGDRPYLAAEDMLSYSAYLYEKYIKNPALELFDSEELIQKAASLLRLRFAKAQLAFKANPTETNTKRYNKINTIMNDDKLLTKEVIKIISESDAVKEACEYRVNQVIQPNNITDFCNGLFKELTDAQKHNCKVIVDGRKTGQIDYSQILKLETDASKLNRTVSHKQFRPHLKGQVIVNEEEEEDEDNE